MWRVKSSISESSRGRYNVFATRAAQHQIADSAGDAGAPWTRSSSISPCIRSISSRYPELSAGHSSDLAVFRSASRTFSNEATRSRMSANSWSFLIMSRSPQCRVLPHPAWSAKFPAIYAWSRRTASLPGPRIRSRRIAPRPPRARTVYAIRAELPPAEISSHDQQHIDVPGSNTRRDSNLYFRVWR